MPYKSPEEGRIKKKEYYQRNRERLRKAAYDRYHNNPDKVRERSRRSWHKNKSKRRAARLKWEAKNKEHLRAYHSVWAKNNRAFLRTYHKTWRDKNPELVFNQHVRVKQQRRAITGVGKLSRGLAKRLMVSQNNRCILCLADLSVTGFHRDHIIPLCKGGKHEDGNIQLLCPKCNLSKGGKILDGIKVVA